MNKNHEIMAQNFTKSFINHHDISLAPQTVSEFPLHHAKGGFDVRPLVVMLQKLVAPELKVMEHFGPQMWPLRARVGS